MDIENVVRLTAEEVEKLLSTKSVVGEPMTFQDVTIVPLFSTGFGFGGGGGTGKGEGNKGEGTGGGSGAGGGIKPVALVIVDKDGARVEPIIGGLAAAAEKIGESGPKLIEKAMDLWTKKKQGNTEKEG